MRPPRLILLLLCFIFLPILLTFLSLLSAHPRSVSPADASLDGRSGRLRSFFSFHAPSSLFPPSAVISLTDDNSTFFLARPAAFGPLLPDKGLSGQLWIGSGFGDEKGGVTTGAEGELGCSDVPGWDEGDKHSSPGQGTSKLTQDSTTAKPPNSPGKGDSTVLNRRSGIVDTSPAVQGGSAGTASDADGTDDHLHNPLPGSYFPDTSKLSSTSDSGRLDDNKATAHADIQSLQEGAEIAGKVVLLSRGGCGFLEKVKWVQRRGGTALIVGDDTRGGGLVTMYARDDTSNVTIPALFTSHTTAHLLSSLIPAGDSVETTVSEDTGKSTHGESHSKNTPSRSKSSDGHGTTFTKAGSKPASTPRSAIPSTKLNSESSSTKSDVGWLRSLFSSTGLSYSSDGQSEEDSRRPPSSGQIDWVLLDDWEEEGGSSNTKKPGTQDTNRQSEDSKVPDQSKKPASKQSNGDDFVIGVQDWRDPDLIAPPTSAAPKPTGILDKLISKPAEKEAASDKSSDSTLNSPKGGSITPGSGEYVDPAKSPDGKTSSKDSNHAFTGFSDSRSGSSSYGGGWWSSRFSWSGTKSSDGVPTKEESVPSKNGKSTTKTSTSNDKTPVGEGDEEEEHEGLWVTLTPTNMSASPFFDTLLVLVVSPLVTLTVVYALLLLRSRIRRRRWRAPKSVVDRLPVRTYQTMASSPPSSPPSSITSHPVTSETSPTSPLLPSNSQPISTRPRPRSQTFSGLFAAWPDSQDSRPSHIEKGISASQPQRSRYTRQIECVVCLEEYVEGQSRVMSLPCGHEFHVECM